MFTLLRNTSLIASILFLLIGGFLYQLRKEKSTAYWLLLTQFNTGKSNQGYPRHDIILAYPDGFNVVKEMHSSSMYQYVVIPAVADNGNKKIPLIKRSVDFELSTGLVSLDILTHKEEMILSGEYIDIVEIPNHNQILVLSTHELYSLNLSDLSLHFLGLLSPHRRIYLDNQNDGQTTIIYENPDGLLYRSNLDGTHKIIISRSQIPVLSVIPSENYLNIIYSPDKSSYIYFNSAYKEWIIFSSETQTSTFIPPHLGTYQIGNFVGWSENNWLIIELTLETSSSSKRSRYYKLNPNDNQFDDLLDSMYQRGYEVFKDGGHNKWLYIKSRVSIQSGEHNILQRINLEDLAVEIVLEGYSSLLYQDYVNDYFIWSEYEANGPGNYKTYAIYGGIGNNRQRLYNFSLATQQPYGIGTQFIEKINPYVFVFTYCPDLSPDRCQTVLINLHSSRDPIIFNGYYITHSPPIDRPYHSKLPFLLSAWCGFLALLLLGLPKVLSNQVNKKSLYPLDLQL